MQLHTLDRPVPVDFLAVVFVRSFFLGFEGPLMEGLTTGSVSVFTEESPVPVPEEKSPENSWKLD
jgi:hypothetical protein